MQETHSSLADENNWTGDFKGPKFFSHGKTNSSEVAIRYIGSDKIDILDKKINKNGRVLIVDVKED